MTKENIGKKVIPQSYTTLLYHNSFLTIYALWWEYFALFNLNESKFHRMVDITKEEFNSMKEMMICM